MYQQFDPNFPGLIEGAITNVTVIDPVHLGNQVIDPTLPFDVRIEWNIFGTQVPMYLIGAPPWDVSVYAESIGPPGASIVLGNISVPTSPSDTCPGVNCTKYQATVTVPSGLLEHSPGPAGPSGVYKIAVVVFRNGLAPGNDLIGFSEGPIILVESPV